MRFTSLLVGVEDYQEGETGDRRQEKGERRQETGDNPPLAPPPPRRGEMGMSEEVGFNN
ncbi:hypothetical protein [Okeania sp. SIO2B9]|uniref:hypothetical protein n=1 Tax=Okeania sp. SIO2B9 TaxID=2607782 RepID=UPI00142A7055|nr:hypothetical protein [Okeania sp. SIO2B9]NES93182.1 hypothetical protein [Okeania sp. SIO2B9]